MLFGTCDPMKRPIHGFRSEVCRMASANRTGKAIKSEVVVKEDQDMRVCRFCHGSLQSIHHKVGHAEAC